ncbi:MAG: PAS domain S-box protein [Geobacteraceae bacterium]|nr:PAS domain S-box protein [Geobacteraceae bacterium]NTW80238.1 PAS domain S-box protein [Geobacteraceae bacterium]
MNYTLKELLDIPRLRLLLDTLDEIHSMPSAIIDTEGSVLTATAWQDICTKFHRINHDTEKMCIESDRSIKASLGDNKQHVVYRCPMGLVDSATPIIIEGKHLGNVFTGQLFLIPPDETQFIKQARQYGFDEEEYLEAMRKVPIFPEEKLHKNLAFIHGLTQMLAEQELQYKRQCEAEERLRKNEETLLALKDTLQEQYEELQVNEESLREQNDELHATEEMLRVQIENFETSQKLLKESEERFRILHDATFGGLFIHQNGIILDCNQGLSDITGFSKEELIGKNGFELIAPGWRDGVVQNSQSGFDQRYEVEGLRKDGTSYPLSVIGKNIPYKGGTARVIEYRDITEQNRVKELLEESEERFHSLVLNIPNIAVQGYTLDGTVIFWNLASEMLYGYSAEEAMNSNLLDLIIPQEMKSEMAGAIQQMTETGAPIPPGELLLKRKDGSRVPVFSSHALVHPFGRQPELFCLDIDLTERKQAEEALRESEYRWKFAIEGSGDGVWDWNILSDEAKYSKRWKEMLGYSENDILPTNQEWVDRIHPDDRSYVAKTMQDYLEGRTEIYVTEYRLRCKDGSYKWILGRGMVVSRSEDSKPLRMIGTHTDITVRKEHEKEQLKIEKLESLGILAGGIAHDFNNILTGIIGNISLAQIFLDATHRSHKPLVEAEKASIRATELAHQLLTFARGGEPVKKVVSVQNIAKETISLVLHGSNVKGNVDIPDSVHAIEADEGQMSQVFHNIIINATQAMPGGGSLTITAQNESLDAANTIALPAGDYVRISFIDQGCGISEDNLKKIFDPYFTTKSAGNGLGLASVHSIVSRHGGHIAVSSITGKGTTFTIHLPSIGETYAKRQTSSAAQTIRNDKGGSILVMDDEKMIRDMTTEMLEYIGYKVTTCENGAEAITLYKTASESGAAFSAVIMDLTIPGGMGGKETAEQILAFDPMACLLVSSGYSNDPIMSDYSTYGFSAAVAKPYKIIELGQLLSAIVKG